MIKFTDVCYQPRDIDQSKLSIINILPRPLNLTAILCAEYVDEILGSKSVEKCGLNETVWNILPNLINCRLLFLCGGVLYPDLWTRKMGKLQSKHGEWLTDMAAGPPGQIATAKVAQHSICEHDKLHTPNYHKHTVTPLSSMLCNCCLTLHLAWIVTGRSTLLFCVPSVFSFVVI